MTPEQKDVPSVKKALAAGKWNPNGFDAVMLRNPGLQDSITAVVVKVYPLVAGLSGSPVDKPAVSPGLMEMAILMLAHEWDFPAMFPSHGPHAVKEGISQEIVDGLARGERPVHMKADEEAVYEFTSELTKKHAVSDETFAKLRAQFSERAVVDFVTTLGVYTNSLMMLKVANIASH
jgi:alkylhydroperoxidase family enzyme